MCVPEELNEQSGPPFGRSGEPVEAGTGVTYSPATYRMRDLPANLRPREVFDRLGPENVDDAILLALILRTGKPGQNVMDLAQAMIRKYGGLSQMARLPVRILVEDWKGQGLGIVKAQMLKAALEMGRRVGSEEKEAQPIVSSPEEAAAVMAPWVAQADTESFWIMVLNTRNRLTAPPIRITQGIMNASLVHPREVFRQAVGRSAASIVLAHNHPSGDPTPSPEDLKITRELVAAGKVMEIRVLDHVIVCEGKKNGAPIYCSLRESGLVVFED